MSRYSRSSYAVIVPTFNAESTIAQTLSAILAQTVSPMAIFLVDDRSTDRTIQAVNCLPNDSIWIHTLEKNSGSAALPRNTGVQLCGSKYDYIAFCDADDIWIPDKMERQLSAMHTLDSQFSFGDVLKFSNTPTQFPTKKRTIAPKCIEVSLSDFRFNNIVKSGSTSVIHKSLSPYIDFPLGDKFRGIEDYYAWMGLLSMQGFRTLHIQEPLVHYRQSSNSVSASKLYMHRLRKETFEHKKTLLKQKDISTPNFYLNELLYLLNQLSSR